GQRPPPREAPSAGDEAAPSRSRFAAPPGHRWCESSALTNMLPVHRLQLGVGQSADAPAAYVRALTLGAERLEQRYTRADDDDDQPRYDYQAPQLAFSCRLA